jgi:hypothetical protein
MNMDITKLPEIPDTNDYYRLMIMLYEVYPEFESGTVLEKIHTSRDVLIKAWKKVYNKQLG